jgi:hypothetical protein
VWDGWPSIYETTQETASVTGEIVTKDELKQFKNTDEQYAMENTASYHEMALRGADGAPIPSPQKEAKRREAALSQKETRTQGI